MRKGERTGREVTGSLEGRRRCKGGRGGGRCRSDGRCTEKKNGGGEGSVRKEQKRRKEKGQIES